MLISAVFRISYMRLRTVGKRVFAASTLTLALCCCVGAPIQEKFLSSDERGVVFEPIPFPGPISPASGGWYVDDEIAYLATPAGLLKTSSGGHSWVLLTTGEGDGFSPGAVYDVFFDGHGDGWISAAWGVLRTHDAGSRWYRVARHGRIPRQTANPLVWVVAGKPGGGYVSYIRPKGKVEWKDCPVPGLGEFAQASFLAAGEGWATRVTELRPGYRTELSRTLDYGCTWKSIWELPDKLEDEVSSIFFLSGKDGWLGGMGTIYRTRDGGQHWSRSQWRSGVKVISLFFSDPVRGWLLAADFGRSGGIYRTDDSGASWRRIPPSAESTIPLDWNRGRLAAMLYRGLGGAGQR
jgi:photosystem II stability/assembly factor-like uncharacterized protein